MSESILNSGARHQASMPVSKMRELALDIEVGGEEVTDSILVVLDESKIGYRTLVSNQPTKIWEMGMEGQEKSTDQDFLLNTSFKTLKIRLISDWNLVNRHGKQMHSRPVEKHT
jgi:hypothetical protein